MAGDAGVREGGRRWRFCWGPRGELGMSPPAVTRAIASLEETIGTRSARADDAVGRAHGSRWALSRGLPAHPGRHQRSGGGSGRLIRHADGHADCDRPVLFKQIYVMPILTEFLDASIRP